MPQPRTARLALAALATLVLLIVSGWKPYDRATWLMEVAPVLVVLRLLCLTCERFALTPLPYVCIFWHAVVLMVAQPD